MVDDPEVRSFKEARARGETSVPPSIDDWSLEQEVDRLVAEAERRRVLRRQRPLRALRGKRQQSP